MKKHTKVYMDFFDYGEQDFIPCEMCGSKAVDVHHLMKQSKFGNKKEKDYIENLIGVCRDCHNKAENDGMFNMFCRIKHLENVCMQVHGMINLNKRLNENKRN
jgi:hypothetical protein